MKLTKAIQLSEKKVPIKGTTKTGVKYSKYRGVTLLVLDENEPPDVHGIPKDLEAYGRGGFNKKNGSLFLDGGPHGSRQGHPEWVENGFYWGVDQDVFWTDKNGKKQKGIIYIRGRAGTSTPFLEKNAITILDALFKYIPKP